MSTHRSRFRLAVSFAVGATLLLSGLVLVTAGGAGVSMADAAAGGTSVPPAIQQTADEMPSEAPFEESTPEAGDEYFEAEDPDGDWISYTNPRDEYRNPYIGEGSGKLCVTLVNEDGDVVSGESVPNTTVTVPTGDSIEWHTGADPMTVDFPLTGHYDRPLDSDQFGTADDIPQGDGLLDAHCIEWHGLPEDETVTYGEATVEGEHADSIDVVGYIQQEHDAWDTDVDPIADAESYEETGGGWTYEADGSHGQAVVVLQLETGETDDTAGSDAGDADDTAPDDADDTAPDDADGPNSDDAVSDERDDRVPGFAPLAALIAISLVVLAIRLR